MKPDDSNPIPSLIEGITATLFSATVRDQRRVWHIDALIDAIRPAVRAVKSDGDEDLVERSVRMNATMVAAEVRTSEPVLADLAEQGVTIQPAYYDLESGEVSWLPS